MNRTRTVLAFAAAGLLAAGGTAYAVADTSPATPASPSSSPSASSPSSSPSSSSAPAASDLTVDQVIGIALKAAPGRVESAEREDDGSWEAKVAGDDGRRHEFTVSASGTAGPRHGDDHDDDKEEDVRALGAGSLTAAEAVAKVRAVHGGVVTTVEFDDSAWTVEIGDRDFTVHPSTGEVAPEKDDD